MALWEEVHRSDRAIYGFFGRYETGESSMTISTFPRTDHSPPLRSNGRTVKGPMTSMPRRLFSAASCAPPRRSTGFDPLIEAADFVEEAHQFYYSHGAAPRCRRGDRRHPPVCRPPPKIGRAEVTWRFTWGTCAARAAARTTLRVTRGRLGAAGTEAAPNRGLRDLSGNEFTGVRSGGMREGQDPAVCLDHAGSEPDELKQVTFEEAAQKALREIFDARAGKKRRGVPTGIPSLDRVTLGGGRVDWSSPPAGRALGRRLSA